MRKPPAAGTIVFMLQQEGGKVIHPSLQPPLFGQGDDLPTPLTVILGPTNTGKTHLAIERMCRHTSGVIGFPLRLLAREAYDRVVRIKGAAQVALLTGEERILPERARYFLCTAESLPLTSAFAFVALDEAQMASDRQRGHVFTNILLHVRGTAETLVLGAETLRPLVERLLPDANIFGRARLSTLKAVPPVKLSRLPRRSAAIAFNRQDIYATAELLRRQKGGVAIVMGSLSPRTRNAQVALYQSGEVDYLVATDAIGMGLNLDIDSIAFTSLHKFDGHRSRRLHLTELAQIAGRAGRYMRDGTFTTILGADKRETGDNPAFHLTPAEKAAIEAHRFPPLRDLFWRNFRLDFTTLPRLLQSLETLPPSPGLRRSVEAPDLEVLRRLAALPWVKERAKGRPAVMRLWAACSLPDFRDQGEDAHIALVSRFYRHLSEGFLPENWVSAELQSLDNVAGNIDTLSHRVAAVRTWAYASHQPDWLRNPAEWAGRARLIEDRLSDTLHARLIERFVSRRTSVLLRQKQQEEATIEEDGAVLVGGEEIGRLKGFRFEVDATARLGEKRLLLAAGKRSISGKLAAQAATLAVAPDDSFRLEPKARTATIFWGETEVATLGHGGSVLHPAVVLLPEVASLPTADKARERLTRWLKGELRQQLAPLFHLQEAHRLSPVARGLVHRLSEGLGVLERADMADLSASLLRPDRRLLRQAGVELGATHVFVAPLLKPEASLWRLALWAAAHGMRTLPLLPPAGGTSVVIAQGIPADFYRVAGYWPIVRVAVRVDIVARIAHVLHTARLARKSHEKSFPLPPALQTVAGLSNANFRDLLQALGFRVAENSGELRFAHRRGHQGQQGHQGRPSRQKSATRQGPFAGLEALLYPAKPSASPHV